ncbi:Colipase, partial [Galemys pyrenaicus]
ETGELCLNSMQCKSRCCHRDTGMSLARCAPMASENSECSAKVGGKRCPSSPHSPHESFGSMSPQTLYGVYYKCPCERGLTCEADKTIVGSITNTNFGICHDAGRRSQE